MCQRKATLLKGYVSLGKGVRDIFLLERYFLLEKKLHIVRGLQEDRCRGQKKDEEKVFFFLFNFPLPFTDKVKELVKRILHVKNIAHVCVFQH